MRKVKLLVDSMRQEFSASPNVKQPALELRVVKEGKGESFYAEYAAGKVRIDAESPLAAVYGIHQISAAVKSGHLPEFLGNNTPRFPLRCFWVETEQYLPITSQIQVGIPQFFSKLAWLERFCREVIALGFNAIVLGDKKDSNGIHSQSFDGSISFKQLCSTLHAFGIKVIVKPTWKDLENRCPLHQPIREKIFEGIP